MGFRQARLRLHPGVVGSSVAAAMLAGLVLAGLLWRDVPQPLLLGWLLVLALALALRVGVARWHFGLESTAPAATWLTRYRIAYLVHGLVWGGLAALLMPQLEHEAMHVLLIGLVGIAGAALVAGAFDLVASTLFAVPTLTPTLLGLLRDNTQHNQGLVAVVLLFVAVMVIAAKRTERAMRDTVLAQQAAVERTDAAEQARAALADQHALLQQLLRGTRQGYWFIDTEGRTTDINSAMCDLLGRPREAVVGRAAAEFFQGPELAVLQRELAARRQGHTGAYEIDIVRPDGGRVHTLNNATPLFDAQGQAVGSVGLWTDLSAQKRIEAELRTFEWVANSQVDLVSVIGQDQRILMVNDAWCEAMGLARQDVVGRLLDDVVQLSPERRRALQECFALHERRTVRRQLSSGKLAGRLLESTLFPYRDEAKGVSCVVIVSRDITEQEASRAAIEAGAEYLRRTLNATGDAIFASDAEDPRQPVRFINEQMLTMWGLGSDPHAPVSAADILAAARPLFVDAEAEFARVAAIVASNQSAQDVLHLRDGRVLRRRCEPARVGERTVRVWSFRDITAEEQALQVLQKSEAEKRRLLDAFPGYISSLDGQMRYRYVNERTAALFGRPAQALVGRSVVEVLGAERAGVNAAEVARVRTGEMVRIERHYPAAAGRDAIDLEVTQVQGGTLPDGTEVFYAFGADITARKHAERALAAARDEAERANRAKSQFLSHMSHELRTPMNAIDGFAQLLEHDTAPRLAEHQSGYVREIRRGARHLLGLINEVLDLGRIESGQLVVDVTPVPLGELMSECAALMQPLALQHQLTLHDPAADPGELAVLADPTRLKQVLLNLLGNAIKYNRPGGDVQVLCRVEGQSVVISVRDSGIGITESQRARLFQAFDRLGAERSAVEGTGIGLALTLRLVQAMNGRIEVHSTPGVGSTFSVHLQRVAERVAVGLAEPDMHAAAAAAPPPRCVLYIEDNPVNVVLMEAMLAHLPEVRLRSAAMPQEGLQMAWREPPDLVLLDIQLPGMDGFEVLARLKAHASTAQVPVVAVSANAMPADQQAALAAGFADYLTKPLDIERLRAVVRQQLAARPQT